MPTSEERGTRVERDSMGEMRVPAEALYGAQTARAVENFPVSGLRFPREFLWALGLVKKQAAAVNGELGRLPAELAREIQEAAQEVQDGKWDGEFVVDIFQTGSGTSTNMNANEVIATRANRRLKEPRVHPNDHVNLGQSSNDVMPTALHLSAWSGIHDQLRPALVKLAEELERKRDELWEVLKIGRTHLQDATPIRLGQEFGGYAAQVRLGIERLESLGTRLGELALGGTAVGTGLNTHPEFARRVIARIAEETGFPLREARNHFEAQSAKDACVEASGMLKTIAVSLLKIANDVRFLGSGPRLGYGELVLPATQPGSSIMPGKINPVMSEMLMQVCAQVMGNDAGVTAAAAQGNFELHTMMPVIGHNLLESIRLLARGSALFAERCVAGLRADEARCASGLERSLGLATALAPSIGYDRAAEIAKEARESGRNVREVAREKSGLDAAQIDSLLNPRNQV